MEDNIIPQNFNQWHHCITVECGIPLTPHYINERIAALTNSKDYHTQQFIKLYGADHHRAVLSWFNQAQSSPNLS